MAKIPVHDRNDSKSKKSKATDDIVDDLEMNGEAELPLEDDAAKETHLDKIEQQNVWKRFGSWFWRKKLFTIPLLLLVILGTIMAIPASRYMATSWFWKEAVVIEVIDDSNGRSVTEATVKLAGQSVKTDSKGKAKFTSIPVGMQSLVIEKKYYQTQTSTIEVPLLARGKEIDTKLHATARFSEVTVTDRISGKAVKAALITISKDDQSRTDESGKAQVVVPVNKKEIVATVTVDGYPETKISIKQDGKNDIKIVPAGKIFFLSKLSGKIDVVSTSFDGSDRKTIVAGTGYEDEKQTVLLATRDWKFLALKARREAGKRASLYVINTADGSMKVFDSGNVDVELTGWSEHYFAYKVNRDPDGKNYWRSKNEALKSYNADRDKISTLDESEASGTNYYSGALSSINKIYVNDGKLIYVKSWSGNEPFLSDKQNQIISIKPEGSGKVVLKAYAANNNYIDAKLYKPQEIYYRVSKSDGKFDALELEDGKIKTITYDETEFSKSYPTFLESPSGNNVFWSESRDGKNAFLIGDKNAESEEQLAILSEATAYGWFTDQYLLLQKKNSELYITTKDQLKSGGELLKISDYHKPNVTFTGYGSGYGGQ
jgi:hypothetical protein